MDPDRSLSGRTPELDRYSSSDQIWATERCRAHNSRILINVWAIPMSIFSVRGKVARLGQYEFDKDHHRYSWIDFIDDSGRRVTVSKVYVMNRVAPLMCSDQEGEFLFETILGSKHLFGIKAANGPAAFDPKSGRIVFGLLSFLAGIPFLLLAGVGLLPMLFGIYLIFSDRAKDRKRAFYGDDCNERQRLHNVQALEL